MLQGFVHGTGWNIAVGNGQMGIKLTVSSFYAAWDFLAETLSKN